MKLTLEHLSPYLPYELEAMVKCDGQEYKATITGFYHFSTELHIECNNGLPGLYRFNTEEEYVKPILRPLSDLTKEIEHNGDKIILSNFFIKYGYQSSLYYLTQPYGLEKVPYFVFEHLIEKHFDVFGLIEKGLAINMNDL